MESIIDILHKGGYSCVMKNREEVRTFTQRGVADLYDLYQADSAFMKGAAIADKVIGKGAAALMVLGGFKTVYADIISFPDYLMPFSSSILKSSLSIPTSSSVRASLWSFR